MGMRADRAAEAERAANIEAERAAETERLAKIEAERASREADVRKANVANSQGAQSSLFASSLPHEDPAAAARKRMQRLLQEEEEVPGDKSGSDDAPDLSDP